MTWLPFLAPLTAADRIARAERWAAAVVLTRRALPYLVGLVLLIGGYCTGKRHTERANATAQYHATQAAIHDTIRVLKDSTRVDTVRIAVAKKAATQARATFDSAASRVEAVADTSPVIPVSMVVPAIATCRDALAADSVVMVAQAKAIVDERLLGNAQSNRADAAEKELRAAHPRFGFRSGIVAGVAVVAALVHFLR